MEPTKLCTLASRSFEGLLRALGWRFSDDPKTSHPCATEFDVRGVRLNVAALNGGACVAGIKPSRIEKIQALLEETAAIPKFDKRQAQVVHGPATMCVDACSGWSACSQNC